ncbi:Protein of unknown function [Gryllus bimaculatus]|nr:Protein of unknown function [Gryllus bimaculatus]
MRARLDSTWAIEKRCDRSCSSQATLKIKRSRCELDSNPRAIETRCDRSCSSPATLKIEPARCELSSRGYRDEIQVNRRTVATDGSAVSSDSRQHPGKLAPEQGYPYPLFRLITQISRRKTVAGFRSALSVRGRRAAATALVSLDEGPPLPPKAVITRCRGAHDKTELQHTTLLRVECE